MTTFVWNNLLISNPATFARTRITNTATMRSVLTNAIQSSERAGACWQLRCEWVVSGDVRDELEALLTRLNGQEHRIRLPMFDRLSGKLNRGAWSGTPVVNGAGQTGYSLNIDGAPASVTGYARPGDLFRYDNGIKMITADADSDGSGNVALEFWPPVRTSPANNDAILTTAGITGVYILTDLAEMPVTDELAGGDYLSRIGATFLEDVLA